MGAGKGISKRIQTKSRESKARTVDNTKEIAQFPWPDDCKIQGGSSGIVFSKTKDTYKTAFFEAFPKNPSTFLRGEGATIAEAEENCWKQYEVMTGCSHSSGFERRKYRNGSGFCVDCGTWFSNVFPKLPEDPNREPSNFEKAFLDPDAAEEMLARMSIVQEGGRDPKDEMRDLEDSDENTEK